MTLSALKMLKSKFPLALLVLTVGIGFLTDLHSATTVTNVYAGVVRHSVTNEPLNGRNVSYEVMVVDLLASGVSAFLSPGTTGLETYTQTTKNFATQYATEVAINTHFYDYNQFAFSSYATDVKGIAASNGSVYSPFDANRLTGLNISAEKFVETIVGIAGGTAFTNTPTAPYTSIQSTRLYTNGVSANSTAAEQRARTQIGVSRDGATLILFASSSGMTQQECADILATQFGAFNVHVLDGGGSTTMVLRTGPTTQTVIAKETSSERMVGASLGIQAGPYVAGIPDTMSWDADPGSAGIQQGSGAWDVTSNNWTASGTNRTWSNRRAATLGEGAGATLTLGGPIAVSGLAVSGGYTIGTPSGPSLTLQGDISTTGTSSTTINASLGGSTCFTKTGNQTLVLGTGSRISMLKIAEGTLDLGGQYFTIIDPITPMTFEGGIVQNGSLVLSATTAELAAPSGVTMLNANLQAAQIAKTGAGTLRLGGAITWTGPLSIRGGTLQVGGLAVLPTTAATISAGFLELDGTNATLNAITLGGTAGAVSGVSTGTGTLTLNGTVTFDASNDPNGAILSGKLAMAASRTFVVNDSANASDDLAIPADISGAFTLTKSGAGTMVLSGNNSFSALTISNGIVRTGIAGTLPVGTLSLQKGLLDLAGFNQTVGAVSMGAVTGATPEIRGGGGTLSVRGNISYSAINNGSGSLISARIDVGDTTRIVTVGDSANAPVDMRIEGNIVGAGSISKRGDGILEIAGELQFINTLNVNGGVLALSGPDSTVSAITLGGVAAFSSILDTGATTLTTNGSLTYSASGNGLGGMVKGHLNLGPILRTFSIGDSTNALLDLRIEAEITGGGGFSKTGAGLLELAGANSLTGPISISAGTLALAHPLALGSSPSLTLASAAELNVQLLPSSTLQIDRPDLCVGGVGTITGNVALSQGSLSSTGSGNLAVTGDLSISGGTTEIKVSTGAGGISVGGSAALGGTLAVTAGGTLAGTQAIPLITASAVTGSFSAITLPTPPAGTIYSVTTTSTQVLMQVQPSTASQSWLVGNGLSPATPLGSDPDGDGFLLLAEYALGGEPMVTDAALTSVALPESALQISFLLNTSANDITYIVEGSSNLASWTTLLSKSGGAAWTGAAGYTQGPAVSGLAPVTVTDPATTTPRFLRIRITKP